MKRHWSNKITILNPIYTTKNRLGKGKILLHQGKDEFGFVDCAYLADALRVLGRPDVLLFHKNCQGKAV